MTIFQKELLRKLPSFHCEGIFNDKSEVLAVSFDGVIFGCQDKVGYFYGHNIADCTDEVNEAYQLIRNQVELIREYVGLYKVSPQMTVEDVKEYRKMSEYGDTVLAGKYNTDFGFMFCTWKQNSEKTFVTHGDYSPDYEYAKLSFAMRSGLVDKNRVFTNDEASNIYRCIDFTKNNNEQLNYEQERELNALAEKLEYGYPHIESSPPCFEQEDCSPQLNM